MENNWQEFKASICNIHGHRVHKVTNSNTTYTIYKLIRKNKWYNIGRPLTEKEFYSIVRLVNTYLAEELLKGNDVELPCRMGRIEIRKYDTTVDIVDGKLKTTMPINWDKTLKLWYEDKDSFDKKTLIREPVKERLKVIYNTYYANYNNKSFYDIRIHRALLKDINRNFRKKKFDVFKLKNLNELE